MKYSIIRQICFWLPGFLVLGVGPLWAADKPVEIFIGGKQYDSLEGYRQERLEESRQAERDTQEERVMFDEALRASKIPLDLKFDPQKMKTVHIKKRAALSPKTRQEVLGKDPFAHSYTLLNQVGFDSGVRKVVSEFAVSPKSGPRIIRADDLERVLRDSLEGADQPLLLISDDKNLRVMMLNAEDHGAEAPKK